MKLDAAKLEYFYSKDITPRSREWYEATLARFLTWLTEQGVNDISELSAPLVRRYLAFIKDTPSTTTGKLLSSHTVHGHARVTRNFMNFCIGEGWLPDGTSKRVKMPVRDQKVMPIFNAAELDKLLGATSQSKLAVRDAALIALLIDSGARASEVCSLTLDRVFLTTNEAYIRVNGKGRKQRDIPLGKKSRLALHKYITRARPESDYPNVFINKDGRPLQLEGLDRVVRVAGERAGIDDTHCHKFRHTYAVQQLANGCDIYRLSRLMGHTSVTITEGYLRAYSALLAHHGTSVLDNI